MYLQSEVAESFLNAKVSDLHIVSYNGAITHGRAHIQQKVTLNGLKK